MVLLKRKDEWKRGPLGSSFTCAKLPGVVTIFRVRHISVNLIVHISYADLSNSKLGWQMKRENFQLDSSFQTRPLS